MSIVLVVGSTGAGKTTYSEKLADKLSAVVYSIDNWMKALYWQDMPKNPDNAWFVENGSWYMDRIGRCESLILDEVSKRARLQQKSILDLGFSTSHHRVKFIKALRELGIDVEVHYLDFPAELRWERVEKRNVEKGETFVMHVDRKMFDFIESIFEPPTAAEGAKVISIQ